jgi:integrase
VEPQSLRDFEQLARHSGSDEPLSALTRLDVFQRLSTALRFAVKWHYLEFNPCDTVSRPSHDNSKRKPAPRREQISRLLRQIDSGKLGTAVVIVLAARLRKGEALALKWEDIEWTVNGFPGFGEVNIARQVQRLGKGVGMLVRDSPKTDASMRRVPYRRWLWLHWNGGARRRPPKCSAHPSLR